MRAQLRQLMDALVGKVDLKKFRPNQAKIDLEGSYFIHSSALFLQSFFPMFF